MLTIGLTGTIATGKSEVARILAKHGARVVDADRLVHEIYAPATPGHEAVVAAFGPDIIAADGSIDRSKLAAVVFDRQDLMARLTGIVWPLTRQRVEAIKREAEAGGTRVLVIEAPLLLEAGWRDLIDQVWLVTAPAAAVRERLINKRGMDAETADARIATRTPLRASEADVVIENDGDLGALAERVEGAWLTHVARELV